MEKKIKKMKVSFESSRLADAEVLIVNGQNVLAVALRYAPGGTPIVLAKGRGRSAKKLVWMGQELDIPIVEAGFLEEGNFVLLNAGEEIPESFYKPVAQVLALVYRVGSTPHLVRFIKTFATRKGKSRMLAMAQDQAGLETISPVALELGEELHLRRGDLEAPLQEMQQRLALELGLYLPEFSIRLNERLKGTTYQIKLREVIYAEGQIDILFETQDGMAPLVNRLRSLLYKEGWRLLGYSEVEALVEKVKKAHCGLVKELFSRNFSISAFRLILRNLLREEVSIRDLPTILETLLEAIGRSVDPDVLTEFVRCAFSYYLYQKYKAPDGHLDVILLSPEMESMILRGLRESASVRWLEMQPEEGLKLLSSLGEEIKRATSLGLNPILLCNPGLRRFLRRLLDFSFPALPVLSYSEIPPAVDVRSIGTIK